MAAIGESRGANGGIAPSKLATAEFYAAKLLPDARALAARIDAGAAPVMSLDATDF